MAEGDDRALLDGPAGEVARSSQSAARAAAALAGLAVGVALAGAFLLPRLRADVPARPLEPRPGALEPGEPVYGAWCRSRHNRRVDV